MPNYINREIGGFKIEKFIAKGGMGSVYIAKHPILTEKAPVAIKVLHSHLVETSNLKDRFRREAKIQSGLKHDSLIQLHQYIEDKNDCFIIMEYFPSKSLSDVIGRQTGPIPSERAIPIFNQILEGIQYAHEKNIIHRDIKPSNILIGKNDVVKIIDLGIAKVADDNSMTATGSVIGTKLYMSPEQIEGKRATKSSDIYSLGITFYEMLAGRVPFESDNDFTVMQGHINTDPEPPTKFYPSIPTHIVDSVMRSISKKPKDRFNSCKHFINSINGKVSAGSKGKKTVTSDGSDWTTGNWVVSGFLVIFLLMVANSMLEEDTTRYSSKKETTTTTTNTTKKTTNTTNTTKKTLSASDYFDEGLKYYNDEKYEKAAESFTNAIGYRNDYDKARFYRARSYYWINNYIKSIRDLNTLLLKDKKVEYYYFRAWAYLGNEDYAFAEDDFTNSIQLSNKEDRAESYFGRGLAKLSNNQAQKSINDFTQAIRINKIPRFYLGRFSAWKDLKAGKKACEDLRDYFNAGGLRRDMSDETRWYYDQNCN